MTYRPDFQYDAKTHTFSFNDTYLNSVALHRRLYVIHFYYCQNDTHLYTREGVGASKEYFYGYVDGSGQAIPTVIYEPGTSNILTRQIISNNSNGGIQTYDLQGLYDWCLKDYGSIVVAVSAAYIMDESDSWHYYSCDETNTTTYFLSNIYSFSFPIEIIDNMYAHITEVHTPIRVIHEVCDQMYICEAQDTAIMQATIFPKANVTGSVNYFWQSRKDDETDWKMNGSKSSFTQTAWNNAVSSSTALLVNRNFHFSAGDMERVTYFRLALAYDNDTLYSNEIQIYAKFLGKYGLYILGERVTSLNCADILGDGKVSYDPETKTLTLNDASISAPANMNVDAVAIYDSITIQCVGEMNSISNYSSNQNAAIVEDAGHVTITGNNSQLAFFVNGGSVLDLQNGLTIKDGCSVIAARTSPMPYATINLGGGVLTVDGASFEADGSTLAPTIANCGGLVLKNAKITSGHTYDATTHKFLTAGGNEATDMIMIESTATGLEGLTVDDAQCTVKKMIIDNHLYIRRDNNLYNATGAKVK